MPESSSYDIIKMRVSNVWMLFIWYYGNGIWYISECTLYGIIKMRDDISDALYVVLLGWEMVYLWMIFVWYYKNGRLYMSECPLYVIKFGDIISLNALYKFYYNDRIYIFVCP